MHLGKTHLRPAIAVLVVVLWSACVCSSSFAQTQRTRTATPAAGAAPAAALSTPKPAAPAAPAVAYLLLESPRGPVNGTSTDPSHMNWISITAVDTHTADAAVGQSSMAAHGSGASGRPSTTPTIPALDASSKDAAKMSTPAGSGAGSHSGTIQITKEIDKSSPLLAQACSSGAHFSSARIDLTNGKHYLLTDVVVSSIHSSGGGDRPTESISFVFQKIEMN
ncbi:MAG TPA: type VI secretion system tube protein Hcp [Candidatus Limnocylindrales bacterium]|nr:type VI secretion system tube protein Hcp [Candidatus Limnocylindrales bacterium]